MSDDKNAKQKAAALELAIRPREKCLHRSVDSRDVPVQTTRALETLPLRQELIVDTVEQNAAQLAEIFLPDAIGLDDAEVARRDAPGSRVRAVDRLDRTDGRFLGTPVRQP
jgi:hypothetical protein